MAFVLTITGLILVVTGVRNTYSQFGALLVSDFVGPQSFTAWALAIGLVGAAGYVPQLRSLSHWFLALILISIFLSKQGFFQKFTQQLYSLPAQPTGSTSTAQTSSQAATTLQTGVQAFQAAAAAGAL